MSMSKPRGIDWTEKENDLIIVDYFDMLRMELSGEPFVKAHRNSELQKLAARSPGSIEYKHQNISAVLSEMGMPWIQGYKPASNFQMVLATEIDRYLQEHKEILELLTGGFIEARQDTRETSKLEEASALVYEEPPIKSLTTPKESKEKKRLIGKYDPAQRDARNRALGKRGEEFILRDERARLNELGLTDLSSKVRWVSEEDGDGAGYDIRSYNERGEERLLEVKTTSGSRNTQFYLSENERSKSVESPSEFRLIRLYHFPHAPKAFALKPPLEDWVTLQPLNYRATF